MQQSINVSGDVTQNPATISEWSVTATGLVDILCTDATSGADVSCTCCVKYTNPLGGPFEVQQTFADKCKVLFIVLGSGGVSFFTLFLSLPLPSRNYTGPIV